MPQTTSPPHTICIYHMGIVVNYITHQVSICLVTEYIYDSTDTENCIFKLSSVYLSTVGYWKVDESDTDQHMLQLDMLLINTAAHTFCE